VPIPLILFCHIFQIISLYTPRIFNNEWNDSIINITTDENVTFREELQVY